MPQAQAQAKRPEIYGIQMLRAVAALAVVCHHALEQSNGAIGRFSPDWLTTSGASGVDIFFVISGFIMFHVSFRSGKATIGSADFLFRRATRIYPFYWLCCLGMLFIWSIGFLASHQYSASLILGSLLLLPGPKLIGVSWTLVYEVYFYLLFAVALQFRSARIAIIGVPATITVIYVVSAAFARGGVAEFLGNPLPLEFCFGLGVAYAYSALAGRGIRWPITLPVAILGLALLAVAPLFVAHPDTAGLPALPRVLAWGVPATLVFAAFLNVGEPRNAITRFWMLLGDASYALYLTHVFVMIGYGRITKVGMVSRLPQLVVMPIIVLIAIAIGLLAHLFVEKPLLGLIRRITHRTPGHASPSTV